MKSLILLLLLVGVSTTAWAQQTTKQSQLVAKRWVIKANSEIDQQPKIDEVYQFMTDGTYTMIAGVTNFTGSWKWAGNDEIIVELDGMIVNGSTSKFDKPTVTHIRIVDSTPNKLLTKERAEGNTWTDGFVVERYYVAI